jgi:serine/threonine-protein kinase HipA
VSTVAEVKLWGRTIGAVALEDGAAAASFEYDPAFIRSGIEIAPLTMPLSRRIYSFPALGRDAFHGLPGLLADSLPDRFGNALINAWLATRGRSPDSFNAVERLCYTGSRGMGALEYSPVIGPRARQATHIEIDRLVELASDVLTHRNNLQASFGDDGNKEEALRDILRVGTSAGGARAKAVIAWNPATNEVRSGQVNADAGFEHWLLKFDGLGADRELGLAQNFGRIEHAYHRMARAAGIAMTDCHLLEENGRAHFMTRRFDRAPGGVRHHIQTLCAMDHIDFRKKGANA